MVPHAEMITIDGGGHVVQGRYPVLVNQALHDFVDRVHGTPRPDTAWNVGHGRPQRALYISSPIGLGHADARISEA